MNFLWWMEASCGTTHLSADTMRMHAKLNTGTRADVNRICPRVREVEYAN